MRGFGCQQQDIKECGGGGGGEREVHVLVK